MLYKQPATEKLERMDNLLRSVIIGMENRTISATDAHQRLISLKKEMDSLRDLIQIEKEIM